MYLKETKETNVVSVSTFALTSPVINRFVVSVGRLRHQRWRPTVLFGFYATLIQVFGNTRQTGDLLIVITFFFHLNFVKLLQLITPLTELCSLNRPLYFVVLCFVFFTCDLNVVFEYEGQIVK